ncbi:MAG: hypothetical protein U1D36_09320 [Hydrogenophaga sp.]|uniref:DUF7210 family protein n=1 Tax=Hydrogenophaga sp. TaxID=1904254 RepID=UPI002764C891|nr:hypothetical protein [Hydrogenophaga sp.]MDP2433465.1 hypothetical protein [Pseudomonadota bacterium]MDZ4174656.1 hypothetical protein [Hydrogenophaga sp.]
MPVVELLKPHTHAGRDYQPRERIELDTALARWLVEVGVARPVLVSDPDRPPHARRRTSSIHTPPPITPSNSSEETSS